MNKFNDLLMRINVNTRTQVEVKTPQTGEAVLRLKLRLKLRLTSILLTPRGTYHFNLNFINFLSGLDQSSQVQPQFEKVQTQVEKA